MEVAALPGFPSTSVFAAIYQVDGSVEAPRGSSVVHEGTTVLVVSAGGRRRQSRQGPDGTADS